MTNQQTGVVASCVGLAAGGFVASMIQLPPLQKAGVVMLAVVIVAAVALLTIRSRPAA